MVIIIIMVIIMIMITVIMVGKVRGGEVREGELGSKTWREGGSSNNIIINSTQKVSSRVLNSRNMMSVARTSYNTTGISRQSGKDHTLNFADHYIYDRI